MLSSLCPSKIHVPSQISLYFSNYMLWSQTLKIRSNLIEWSWRSFFPSNVCFLKSIKWRCKQINKKKTFFVTKISFEGCLCVRNVSITHRGHLFYFRVMDSYWVFTNFQVILHIPIWVLLILGAHPFFGSNSPYIGPWWHTWFLYK